MACSVLCKVLTFLFAVIYLLNLVVVFGQKTFTISVVLQQQILQERCGCFNISYKHMRMGRDRGIPPNFRAVVKIHADIVVFMY